MSNMDHEILSIETAEKLAKYKKLSLIRKNTIQYLKNQIAISQENIKTYKDKNNKEQLIVARSRIALAQEILYILNEKK